MSILKPPQPRLQRGNPLARGLVGAWPCAEGSGPTAYDISGNGKHGTLINSPAWIGGHAGSAINFVGASSQYVSIPSPATGTITSFTIMARMYTPVNSYFAFGWSDDSSSTRAFFVHDGGGDTVYFVVENGGNSYPNCAWGRTGWHHIAMVYNGGLSGLSRLSVYIDGVLQTLTAGGEEPPASYIVTGGFNLGVSVWNGNYMTGAVDDARFYNRALSSEDIGLTHTSPAGLFRPSSAQFLSVIGGVQLPPPPAPETMHIVQSSMRW